MLAFINVLGKKGCYKAAFEFSKVLYRLNVVDDPVGALMCLDYSALSARDFNFLPNFIKFSNKELSFP